MSSHRVSSGTRPGSSASPSPPTLAARHGDRPPPFNMLLTSAMLGGVLAVMCAACYCCGRASRARKPRENSHSSNIFTLSAECPHNHSMISDQTSDSHLGPRRPPTPGPPPAYDSVVSSTDKLRRFGDYDEECVEEVEKFERYLIEGTAGPEELVISRDVDRDALDILNYCTITMSHIERFDGRVLDMKRTNNQDSTSSKSESESKFITEDNDDSDLAHSSVERMDHITEDHSICLPQKKTGILKTPREGSTLKEDYDDSLPSYEVAICTSESKSFN